MINNYSLLIIDGHHLLFRMFYGVQSQLRSKDGVLINAVLGFIGSLIKYINETKPKQIIVVFDSNQPNFRKRINNDYKGNRQSDYSAECDDRNPFVQLPIIKELLEELDIKYCEVDGYEADDIIATYSTKYSKLNKCIISGDSDLLQLVDGRTIVYMDRGKKSIVYDTKKVIERFNVTPLQIADYKAIVGDSSDNIKGVYGIGPKTASKLIKEFHSIENILDSLQKIEPERIRKKIENDSQLIINNKSIIKLKTDVFLPFHIEELSLNYNIYKSLTAIELLKKCSLI